MKSLFQPPFVLRIQSDGSVAIYDANNEIQWTTASAAGQGYGPFTLSILDTGRIVLTDITNTRIWASYYDPPHPPVAPHLPPNPPPFSWVRPLNISNASIFSPDGRFRLTMQGRIGWQHSTLLCTCIFTLSESWTSPMHRISVIKSVLHTVVCQFSGLLSTDSCFV